MEKFHFSYGFTPHQHQLTRPAPALIAFASAQLPQTGIGDFVIRPVRTTDLADWYGYLQKEQVKALMSWDVKSPEDLQQFIQSQWHNPQQNQIKWAITDQSQDRLIGTLGFHSIDQQNESCEVAYDLNPNYWNRGIITQVCRKMTAWAHEEIKLRRIAASVMLENQGSRRVLEKSGYNLEGVMRSYRKVRGIHKDYWLLSSLRNI
ncbi:GNAT family N-acetyltransferase [Undibacterium sp. LX40W]|uniref:GNAT family N-acetyltransferase n=1 Tax=Undibacterium nitidum TaxID=2762298 RepID=A0A923KUG6_9BURK|nr:MULTISPECIES: GNAT family N-acetyltransferase [Undibacterium]MBC3882212.1 GNAT family N-acetyltransferase [Undibacterium nitidum]MBC3892493.1 GNAT family N-acetyltransferase [Undibacterium sp. LX40W]